jgi:hypothetical protein
MEMDYLTNVEPASGKGKDTDGISNKTFDIINTRKYKAGVYYVRGHLLNANLHGPSLFQNLVPLTYQANIEHESKVESILKDGVNAGKEYHYRVSAHDLYGPSDLLSRLSSPVDDTLIDIVKAESFVPRYLSIDASEIGADGSMTKLNLPNIPNRISQTKIEDYQLGTKKFKTVVLESASETDLLTLPSIKQNIVSAIVDFLDDDNKFNSYNEFTTFVVNVDPAFDKSIIKSWIDKNEMQLYKIK